MYKQLTEFLERKRIHNKEVLDHICSFFTLAKAKSKTILLDYNQVSNEYYFVNKGYIRLFTVNKEGVENSRYFAFEGNFVSALPSFIDQKIAEEFMQTIEKCELLTISRVDFYLLVNTIPEFARIYTEILELGFINAKKNL